MFADLCLRALLSVWRADLLKKLYWNVQPNAPLAQGDPPVAEGRGEALVPHTDRHAADHEVRLPITRQDEDPANKLLVGPQYRYLHTTTILE